MVPHVYPAQQVKTAPVVHALSALIRGKSEQENIAAGLPGKLAVAIEKANRIMAEDIIREAGYMLPQSDNSKAFLRSLQDQELPEDFPAQAVERLLEILGDEK